MDSTKPKAPLATDKFCIELETNGPVAPQAGQELEELLQAPEPKPKGHFRQVEFPDETVEKAQDKIRELAARSPQRDEELARNPLPPDEKARRLAELKAGIDADTLALGFVRIEIHPADEDPFSLFTTNE
jgi:hypothetical protein